MEYFNWFSKGFCTFADGECVFYVFVHSPLVYFVAIFLFVHLPYMGFGFVFARTLIIVSCVTFNFLDLQ